MYPWYVYQPTRTKERRKSPSKSRKGSRSTSSTASSRTDFTSESCEDFFADSEDADSPIVSVGPAHGFVHSDLNGNLSTTFALPASSRRASSAPTPPPAYSGIKIPTLFTPSCPSSPKLAGVSRPPGQVHTRLLAPPDPSMPYAYLAMESPQSIPFGVESMDANGQVPIYGSEVSILSSLVVNQQFLPFRFIVLSTAVYLSKFLQHVSAKRSHFPEKQHATTHSNRHPINTVSRSSAPFHLVSVILAFLDTICVPHANHTRSAHRPAIFSRDFLPSCYSVISVSIHYIKRCL